jgi:hypothetical protein
LRFRNSGGMMGLFVRTYLSLCCDVELGDLIGATGSRRCEWRRDSRMRARYWGERRCSRDAKENITVARRSREGGSQANSECERWEDVEL